MISRYALTGLALAIASGSACALKTTNVFRPDPRQDLILLLPDGDGSVGRATVTMASGSVTLDAEREATSVPLDGAPPVVATLDEGDVEKIFGGALDALPPPPDTFTLFFRFESEELTDDSRALASEVLQTVKDRPFPEVVVRGHTDTTGSATQNFELGLKRANRVRSLLVERGVDADAIQVISHGESELLVPTADDVFEPRNRRVDITVR